MLRSEVDNGLQYLKIVGTTRHMMTMTMTKKAMLINSGIPGSNKGTTHQMPPIKISSPQLILIVNAVLSPHIVRLKQR